MNDNFNKNFAVIFDLDGMIVDINPAHNIALRKFCERHGYHLSDIELKVKIYGRANKDWLPDIFAHRMTPVEYKNWLMKRKVCSENYLNQSFGL